jgi:transcriptional regulator with XRE-family HTH domain
MNLRTRREQLGLTVQALADRVGTTQPYLTMLESGVRNRRRISAELALALARELQTTPEAILGLRRRAA